MASGEIVTHQAGERAVKAIVDAIWNNRATSKQEMERTLREMGVDALIDAGQARREAGGLPQSSPYYETQSMWKEWDAALDKVLKAGG